MTKYLQEQLESLKRIRPTAVFLARGRANLMSAITPPKQRISLGSLIPAFRMSFATAALALLIFISVHETPVDSTNAGTAITSLDTSAIQAERLSAKAAGPVANTAYFKGISPVVSLALTDIADPTMNWNSGTKVKQAIAVLTKDH